MLLEFSVTNFRSIYKKQTLSLVASSSNELAETNIYELNDTKHKVVRSAVIYGPNAAGKSNLLRAAAFAQSFIIYPLQEGIKIPVEPFVFSKNAQNEPTEFEFLFVEEGMRYNYCFAITKERVTKEWLVAYPHNEPQRLFEREYNNKTQKYTWSIGVNFKGTTEEKSTWQNLTRDSTLFLSTAVNLNNNQLRPIFKWVREKLVILLYNYHNTFLHPLSLSLLKNEKKHLVRQFMEVADVGIEDLELTEEELPTSTTNTNFNINISSNLRQFIIATLIKVLVFHKTIDSEERISLNMEEESEGTRRIFQFAGPWIKCLEDGATILVDELERSLHPMITRFLVSLFHDSISNSKGAQLIFTTHDANLLDTELFRRDQIWFVEKHTKYTNLYSLLDYSPRKDEALKRGYLKGRYGAIPFIGIFNF